jgi:CBS domain containing-hemolysin-like protein
MLSSVADGALALLLVGGVIRLWASVREAALVQAPISDAQQDPKLLRRWRDALRGSLVIAELSGAAMLLGLVLSCHALLGWGGLAAAVVLTPLAFFVVALAPRALTQAARLPLERLLAGAAPEAWARSGLASLVRPDTTGEAASSERRMINRVFDFANVTVREIMVPLVNVSAVREDTPIDEVIRVAQREAFSRLPVYQDRLPNITGVLHTFDLLQPGEAVKAADLMRAPCYAPEMIPAAELLRRLQALGVNLAVAVDEHGGAVGIVAVEDILEEVVGEIEDEYDVKEDPVRKVGPRTYLVNARAEIMRLNERFAWRLPVGEYETLGGLLLDRFKGIPVVGDTLDVGSVHLRVTRAAPRSVEEIAVEELEDKP